MMVQISCKLTYLRYCQYDTKVRQAVAVLPWGHNLLLMSHDLSPKHIVFYANEVFRSSYNLGFILCAEKDHLEVELALQDVNKPIGVAEYQYLLQSCFDVLRL
jgi:hypothetical protein